MHGTNGIRITVYGLRSLKVVDAIQQQGLLNFCMYIYVKRIYFVTHSFNVSLRLATIRRSCVFVIYALMTD